MPWWILLLVVLGMAGTALVVAYRAAMRRSRRRSGMTEPKTRARRVEMLVSAWAAHEAAVAEAWVAYDAAVAKAWAAYDAAVAPADAALNAAQKAAQKAWKKAERAAREGALGVGEAKP